MCSQMDPLAPRIKVILINRSSTYLKDCNTEKTTSHGWCSGKLNKHATSHHVLHHSIVTWVLQERGRRIHEQGNTQVQA
jgi:hypothetical protein